MLLKNKHILLGIGGSIAAYKAPELIRLLQKEGAQVQVMLSKSARHFVTPLTVETLSGNPVLKDIFQHGVQMPHLRSSREADIVLIAPATANMIAQFSYGLAYNLIASTVLGAKCPVVIAPAMNETMWRNPIVQSNVYRLQKAGYFVINPETGYLACGENGDGRLVQLPLLIHEIVKILTPKDFSGCKILLTAGATREYADPVRFLSNASSGKMALALAQEAYWRGGDVTVIHGFSEVEFFPGMKVIKVKTAEEMCHEVLEKANQTDIFIAAAAVTDFRFQKISPGKIKKKTKKNVFLMEQNKDILMMLSQNKVPPFLVAFSLETERPIFYARKKFQQKKLDFMIINNEKVLGSDESQVFFMFGEKGQYLKKLMKLTKTLLATKILDQIKALYFK